MNLKVQSLQDRRFKVRQIEVSNFVTLKFWGSRLTAASLWKSVSEGKKFWLSDEENLRRENKFFDCLEGELEMV